MLKKREVFRKCFDNFDYCKIAAYQDRDVRRILNTPDMIKSERKIKAVIQNARAYLNIRREFGSFSSYMWDFCGGKTILYTGHDLGKVPVSNGLSARLSSDLKKRGFTFLGPVTIYSYLQACGIINDHSRDCALFMRINRKYPTVRKKCDHEVF